MTTGSDAYILGKIHGGKPGKVYDPPYWMSSVDKEQYRKGYSDARKERGLE